MTNKVILLKRLGKGGRLLLAFFLPYKTLISIIKTLVCVKIDPFNFCLLHRNTDYLFNSA